MNNETISKIKMMKNSIKEQGFLLIGIFGSVARGEENNYSDIDILYKIENLESYLKEYSGWDSISHIVDVKKSLENSLNKKVDFVDIDSLNEVGKKHILKELVYV
jgi:predicted nucleotidyltransferase